MASEIFVKGDIIGEFSRALTVASDIFVFLAVKGQTTTAKVWKLKT